MLYCLRVFHKSWLPCASVIRPEPCLLGCVFKVDTEYVRVSCSVGQRNLCMGGLKVGQTGGHPTCGHPWGIIPTSSQFRKDSSGDHIEGVFFSWLFALM
jgi:hypothetical protein